MSTPEIRATSVVSWSALALLVPGVLADHQDPPVPADHLALLAHRLDTRSHLHDLVLFLLFPILLFSIPLLGILFFPILLSPARFLPPVVPAARAVCQSRLLGGYLYR
jgi:hypothetical protein